MLEKWRGFSCCQGASATVTLLPFSSSQMTRGIFTKIIEEIDRVDNSYGVKSDCSLMWWPFCHLKPPCWWVGVYQDIQANSTQVLQLPRVWNTGGSLRVTCVQPQYTSLFVPFLRQLCFALSFAGSNLYWYNVYRIGLAELERDCSMFLDGGPHLYIYSQV